MKTHNESGDINLDKMLN